MVPLRFQAVTIVRATAPPPTFMRSLHHNLLGVLKRNNGILSTATLRLANQRCGAPVATCPYVEQGMLDTQETIRLRFAGMPQSEDQVLLMVNAGQYGLQSEMLLGCGYGVNVGNCV